MAINSDFESSLLDKNNYKLFPLTESQKGLWTEWLHDPLNTDKNTGLEFRITGALNIKRFNKAYRHVIQYFDTFRVAFIEKDNQVYQYINDFNDNTNIDFIDYSEEKHTEKHIETIITQYQKKPFDLKKSVFPRFRVIKLGDKEYHFSFIFHHILTDALSTVPFLNLLSHFYNNSTFSIKMFLAKHNTFENYLMNQTKYPPTKTLTSNLFWKKELKNIDTSLVFPNLNFTQDHIKITSIKKKSFSGDLTHKLKAHARKQRSTVFIHLMSLYSIMLYRYTNQSNFTIGFPVSLRPASYSQVIGCFINILPFKVIVNPSHTFSQHVESIKLKRKILKQYFATPYSYIHKLYNEQSPSLPVKKLYNCSFAESNFFLNSLQLNHLKVENTHTSLGAEKDNAISLFYDNSGDKLQFVIEYDNKIFDNQAIELFWKQFLCLTNETITNPNFLIDQYSLLENSYQKHLLNLCINTIEAKGIFNQGIIPNIIEHIRNNPRHTAIIFDDQHITYDELGKQFFRITNALGCYNLPSSSRIGVMLPRSAELIVSFISILFRNAIYIPIDPQIPIKRLQKIHEDCRLDLIIASEECCKKVSTHLDVECMNIMSDNNNQHLTRDYLFSHHDEDIIYIIYTSGSTGNPKGVAIKYKSLLSRLQWLQQTFQLTSDDVVLQNISPSFDPSIYEILWPLMCGSTLLLTTEVQTKDPRLLKQKIDQHKVSIATFVPSYLTQFLSINMEKYVYSIRGVISGGEALFPNIVEQFYNVFPNALLYNVYGPTEATIITTHYLCDKKDKALSNIPIGKPIYNTSCYIANDNMQLQPFGIPGELYIGGIGVAHGYVNQKALTSSRFIPNPFSDTNDMLYKTGDIARYLPCGNIEFIGRIDEQVKVRGYRIELSEIKTALLSTPSVNNAEVILDERGNISAFVQQKELIQLDKLKYTLRQYLPHYMIPQAFHIVESIPLKSTGKADIETLKLWSKKNSEKNKVHNSHPNNHSIKKRILAIWQSILDRNDFIESDNFFDAGGNSLSVIELSLAIEQTIDKVIPAHIIYEYPTVDSFVEFYLNKKSKDDIDFTNEITLPAITNKEHMGSFIPLDHAKYILITGATGYIGNMLLTKMIQQNPHIIIYCLVRKKSHSSFLASLKESINTSRHLNRIKVLLGDISKKNLGLDPDVWDMLADTIDIIYHCAAEIGFVQPYQQLKPSNVEGTKSIITLASSKKTKTLHYISTGTVFHTKNKGNAQKLSINESTPLISTPENLINGYAQSKWVAEHLVQQFALLNKNVTIYRVGTVYSNCKHDRINRSDLVNLITKAMITSGFYPEAELEFNLIPSDYVISAILHASNHHKFSTLHLLSNNHTKLDSIVSWLKNMGYSLSSCSLSDWCDVLEKPSDGNKQHDIAKLIPLIRMLAAQNSASLLLPHLTDSFTKALLPPSLLYNHMSEHIFQNCLEILQDKDFIPEDIMMNKYALATS